jgi:hypothetical protein
MSQKNIFILLFTIAIFFGLIGLYTIVKHPSYYQRIKTKIERTFNTSKRTTTKKSPSDIINSPYSCHIKSGKKYGVLLQDNKEIRTKTKEGKLIKVKKNTGYRVQHLNHSKDVLVQPSYLVLQEIGKRFHSDTKGKYFTVTSLTRSVEAQKKLTKTNLTATKNTSSHSYGVSFDISYIRFNGVKGPNPQLKASLEKILVDLRNEKKIYFIHEISQSCYHVSVR